MSSNNNSSSYFDEEANGYEFIDADQITDNALLRDTDRDFDKILNDSRDSLPREIKVNRTELPGVII